MTSQFTKLAGYAARADDPETKEHVASTKKVGAERRPGDFVVLSGYAITHGIAPRAGIVLVQKPPQSRRYIWV